MSYETENYYIIARRAMDSGDNEKAEKYYELILAQEPNSWEAQFYTSYCSAMQTNIANIESAANKIGNIAPAVFNMVKALPTKAEQLSVTAEITLRLIAGCNVLFEAARKSFDELSVKSGFVESFFNRVQACMNALDNSAKAIVTTFIDEDIRTFAGKLWKECIAIYEKFANYLSSVGYKKDYALIQSYQNKIYCFDIKARKERITSLKLALSSTESKIKQMSEQGFSNDKFRVTDKESFLTLRIMILIFVCGIVISILSSYNGENPTLGVLFTIGSVIGLIVWFKTCTTLGSGSEKRKLYEQLLKDKESYLNAINELEKMN